MSDVANFNPNSILQSISRSTPEELTAFIRRWKKPMQILGFTAAPGIHTCYFRSRFILKEKKDGKLSLVGKVSPNG